MHVSIGHETWSARARPSAGVNGNGGAPAQGNVNVSNGASASGNGDDMDWVLRSGGLKVRLAQVDCVGEFKGKGSGRVFGNDQR